ncbi:MAG: PIN domain-containing protein [Halobacteriota archaeon]|nr:PIN domain-containing protein [Halobacteriota archaeon]
MFLDTSAVIELFLGSKLGTKVLEAIKEDDAFISIVTYAEVAMWCKRNGKDIEVLKENIEKIANTVDLTSNICYEAANITFEEKQKNKSFGIIDGIIMASARSVNQQLITKDRHFEGFSDVVIL